MEGDDQTQGSFKLHLNKILQSRLPRNENDSNSADMVGYNLTTTHNGLSLQGTEKEDNRHVSKDMPVKSPLQSNIVQARVDSFEHHLGQMLQKGLPSGQKHANSYTETESHDSTTVVVAKLSESRKIPPRSVNAAHQLTQQQQQQNKIHFDQETYSQQPSHITPRGSNLPSWQHGQTRPPYHQPISQRYLKAVSQQQTQAPSMQKINQPALQSTPLCQEVSPTGAFKNQLSVILHRGLQKEKNDDDMTEKVQNKSCTNDSTNVFRPGFSLHYDSQFVPRDWSIGSAVNQETLPKHYAQIVVEETSQEYTEVSDLFYKTLSSTRKIVQVERIENGELLIGYNIQREKMKRSSGLSVIDERRLFHGTTQNNIESICRQGFDFRFGGSRIGAIYGRGSYFAKEAAYSDSYSEEAQRVRKMFLARVLVGHFTEGQDSYVRPPPKSRNNPHDLYDTCVDNVTDPQVFVVFTLDQAYPEYIITYICI